MTDWQPNENQRAVLEYCRERSYAVDVTAMCQHVGISTQAYYHWSKCPAFVKWYDEHMDGYFALRRGAVIAATLDAATAVLPRGSSPDRKLFLERYDKGYKPQSRKEVAHEGGVNVTDMEPDELRRLKHAIEAEQPEDG